MTRKTRGPTTSSIRIDLQGADSAHYRSIKHPETRAIAFPDGITRLITMERRDWQGHDEVRAALRLGSEQYERVLSIAMENTPPGHPHFEPLVQYAFTRFIRTGWKFWAKRQNQPVNN